MYKVMYRPIVPFHPTLLLASGINIIQYPYDYIAHIHAHVCIPIGILRSTPLAVQLCRATTLLTRNLSTSIH